MLSRRAITAILAAVLAVTGGRAATAETSLRLTYGGPSIVRVGDAVRLEVRASTDRSLTAVMFDLSATGQTTASLTARSADPAAENGLTYVSAVEQFAPFESGLPHDFATASAREVLLHFGEPPFDGVPPDDDVLVEWVEITPTRGGELTIHLSDVQAASTQWHRDGVLLAPVTIDPTGASVALSVTAPYDGDEDGDVDLNDFTQLEACHTGPGIVQTDDTCLILFDDDRDGDVDLFDLGEFQAAFTGQDTSSAPSSANPTVSEPSPQIAEATGEGADVNGDQTINDEDLTLVRQGLGQDPTDPDYSADDANDDGAIDLLDLIFVRNWIGETLFSIQSISPDFRITELNLLPDTGPLWVELTHTGAGSLDTLPFYIANEKGGFFYFFSNLPDSLRFVPPGFRLVISFDGPSDPTWIGDPDNPDAVIVHVAPPYLPPDPDEDACDLLLQNFNGPPPLLDRVAWGGPGQLDSVLNPQATPLPPGGSLGRDEYEPQLWRVYPTATPGYPNGVSRPDPYFPYPNLEFEEGDAIRFVWTDVRYGELQYRLQVADQAGFTAPVIDQLVEDTVYDLPTSLPAGPYTWRVRVEAGDYTSDWSNVSIFSVLSAPAPAPPPATRAASVSIEWFRQNPLPLPRKDTKLLCLECKWKDGPHAWDAVHSAPNKLCPHARHYRAFSVLALINHYYGGSVLLDQIALEMTSALYHDPLFTEIQPFGHESGFVGSGGYLALPLLRVLGLDEGLVQNVSLQAGFENSIDNVLRDGRPIVATRNSSLADPIIVFGYIPATETQPERIVAVDPGLAQDSGLIFTVTAPVSVLRSAFAPAVPPVPGLAVPLQEDPDMSRDTDGDGLMDYDELHRFLTFYDDRDSDSDGIDDKTEVFSYQFGKGRIPRSPDIDDDNLRAENDSDTDNDGCPDGDEDKNHNGNFDHNLWTIGTNDINPPNDDYRPSQREQGESDPFRKDVYELKLTPGRTGVAFGKSVPIDISLRYNDNSADKKPGVKDARIELLVLGEEYRGDLADSEVTTDKDGHAKTKFTAGGDISGDVEIKAIYRQCENATSQWEAVIGLTIAELDWMFAIQTEAVLTQPEVLHLSPVQVTLPSPSASGRVARLDYRYKNGGFQRIEGVFFHPDVVHAGKHIDTISVVPSYAALYINDIPSPNSSWYRTTEDQEPLFWRIEVSDVNAYAYDRLPHYLLVQGEGFQVRTPLLTWGSVESQSLQNRDFVYTGSTWKVLSYAYTTQSASVYFGDGSSGSDTAWGEWPANMHTNVSFIPVGTVNGYNVGLFESGGWWPLDWPSASGDAAYTTNVFGLDKNDIQIIAPFSWSVTSRSATSDVELADALRQEIEALPRITPPPLIGELVFQRDYLSPEQAELDQRGLEGPDYFITMRSRD